MEFRRLQPGDKTELLIYFEGLSDETKRRYGPHPFDQETANALCEGKFLNYLGFVTIADNSNQIIAYTVVVPGFIDYDLERYQRYQISLDLHHDFTMAPSVADAYQSKGIGSTMFWYMERELKKLNARRLILWGGVQATNTRAVNFYKKFGFIQIGEFEHNGPNLDMYKELTY